jgi:putative selenate reductase
MVQVAKDSGAKDVTEENAGLINLQAYAEKVRADKTYSKSIKKSETIKGKRDLSFFDCINAPCVDTCPTNQDIPSYMRHVANGEPEKAVQVIMDTNPFPNVLGQVCDHTCTMKCTRLNYDNTLLIREIKRYAAEKVSEYSTVLKKEKSNGKTVAVIGAGPSGLSCAFYLTLNGFKVDVFEAKPFAGGMVSDAIPKFRLEDDAIKKDVEFIKSAGVNIKYDSKIGQAEFDKLRKDYDFIYVGAGAQKAKHLDLDGEYHPGIMDCLSFLAQVRQGKPIDLGKNVAIIGGGNSAMDAARTAWRTVGKDGSVTVVYRRGRKEMPADADEIEALMDEGIKLMELTSPKALVIENGKVTGMTLVKMELGKKDISGRARPIPVEGSDFTMNFDTIIPAIGQDTVVEFIEGNWIKVDEKTRETEFENVFAGGDAARGASTVVWAVSDGRISAANILAKSKGLEVGAPPVKAGLSKDEFKRAIIKKSVRVYGQNLPEEDAATRCNFDLVHRVLSDEEAKKEAARCLDCDLACSVCVTVCPNRANYTVFLERGKYAVSQVTNSNGLIEFSKCCELEIRQEPQIVNIGNFCNGCGNCTTFCPTNGAPFRDKPTVFLNEQGLLDEEEGFFLKGNVLKGKLTQSAKELLGSGLVEMKFENDRYSFSSDRVKCTLDSKLNVVSVEEARDLPSGKVYLRPVTEMGIIFKALKNEPVLQGK